MMYVFHTETGSLVGLEDCVLVDDKLFAALFYEVPQSQLTMSMVDTAIENLSDGDPEAFDLIINESSDAFPKLTKLIGDQG